MITKNTIDKIFSAIRVEEIIGEYMQLKRAGSNLKGLSPFKEEKTPSFVVSPSKQIWKDFSTGKGGTAISFLMEIENFTYPEALRHAAKKYGIEIEEDTRELSDAEKLAQTERDVLYKIHEIAADFFQQQLWNTDEGRTIGYSYFRERGLSDDIVRKFSLGYSPEQRNAFTSYAKEKGYSREILEKSGLSIFPEHAKDGVDRFRERVIFPIHSFSGRVLGFGARILKNNAKTAKYLNSPETEIYHKSTVLYGIHQGKQAITRKNSCLLVEGYMDVIALHRSGIENVVASSGTSLTKEQIKLIKRLTEHVTILFDGDTAGIKASFRSIDLLLGEGMNIRVLLFPDGDDPDSFAAKHPGSYVEEYIEKHAVDFIEFKAEVLLKESIGDPIKKAEAIRDIMRSVGQVQNALKREIYTQEVATRFGISEQSLVSELTVQRQIQQQSSPRSEGKASAPVRLEVTSAAPAFSTEPLLALEEKLIELVLKYGDVVLNRTNADGETYQNTVAEEIVHHLEEDSYEILSPLNQKIFNEIKEGLEAHELRTENFFIKLMDEEIATKLADNLKYQDLNSWDSRNIFPVKIGDRIAQEVEDDILIHKSHYIESLVNRLKADLNTQRDTDEAAYFSTLQKILLLEKLNRDINARLNRVLTKSHTFYKE